MERVFTAVDVSNVFKSCRETYGANSRIDFQKLAALIPSLRYPDSIQQRLLAYIVTDPDQKHHAFEQVLYSFGYQVKQRFLKYAKGLTKPMHSDWDVGITIDAVDQLDLYDTFALVSGDGDFSQLLDYIKKKGKKTLVLTFQKSTSKSLYEVADELHLFTNDIVFTQGNL